MVVKKERILLLVVLMLLFTMFSGLFCFEQTVAEASADGSPVDEQVSGVRLSEMSAECEASGDIASEPMARSLKNHVQGLTHYFDQGNYEKATKHIDGFIDLVEQLYAIDIVSEQAEQNLVAYAKTLQQSW